MTSSSCLPPGCRLRRGGKSEALHTVSDLHMDVRGVLTYFVRVELLLLRR